MSFLDTIKHAAFEDEPGKPQPKPSHAPAPHQDAGPHTLPPVRSWKDPEPDQSFPGIQPVQAWPQPDGSAMASAPQSDNSVYQDLLSKTEFATTPIGAILHKYLDPLSSIPDTAMPEELKLRTAVLQAKAQGQLNEDQIFQAFDGLKSQLQVQQDRFDHTMEEFTAHSINDPQAEILRITDQIAQLQQQLVTLSGQLAANKSKAAGVKSTFSTAVQRRSQEIDQQKAKYQTILRG